MEGFPVTGPGRTQLSCLPQWFILLLPEVIASELEFHWWTVTHHPGGG